MMRWHQNIAIDGKAQRSEYSNRKHSRFFNEGKWHNFIRPQMPSDVTGRTFVEIGCNVGLYLKMATECGFRRVVGVEANPSNCRMAERYRDANRDKYTVLNRTVGKDFDFDELPVADVVLLSNVHYHIPMSALLPFIDRLRWKVIDCIVVSRRLRTRKHGYPKGDPASVQNLFSEWAAGRVLETTEEMLAGDPHPRRLSSSVFRSRLQRQPILNHTRSNGYLKHQEFIDLIRGGGEVRLENTLNWAFWAKRKPEWDEHKLREWVQYRFDFAQDVMTHGQKEPILVAPDGSGIDGGNRAAMLKLLGDDSIVVRTA